MAGRLARGAVQLHEHADLAAHVAVAADVVRGQLGGARHGHVLADLGDLGGDAAADRAISGHQRRVRLVAREDDVGDLVDQRLEAIVARHEVGLAIDLGQHAQRAVVIELDADDAFRGDAAGALGGLRHAALAQVLDRGVDVAVALGQRRLAFHHARAGTLAQVLDHLSSDCHGVTFQKRRRMGDMRMRHTKRRPGLCSAGV